MSAARVVDLFAGAGGASTGIVQRGGTVVAAVNHWTVAVASHRLNHPTTRHVCQDAALMDPRDLPAFDVLAASPSCQGHSRARGTDRPHHDGSRATAWCVVNVLDVCRPRAVMVENVSDFVRWALYPSWLDALARLGYRVTTQVLDAAAFGVPQERSRYVLVGTLGTAPPTIRAPGRTAATAREILDLDGGTWSAVADKAPATLRRIAAGRARFGAEFLAPYYGSGSGLTGRSLDRPVGTITCLDRWAIVRGDRMRMLTPVECLRAQGFPEGYQLTGTRRERIQQTGNAYPPAMAGEVFAQITGERTP